MILLLKKIGLKFEKKKSIFFGEFLGGIAPKITPTNPNLKSTGDKSMSTRAELHLKDRVVEKHVSVVKYYNIVVRCRLEHCMGSLGSPLWPFMCTGVCN